MFLNLGAGPLRQPLSKFFVRRSLLAADYVSLRDEKSQALVNKIGFTGESRVCPDSVYGLELIRADGSRLEGRAHPIVGFAPMPYPGPRGDLGGKELNAYDEFIRKLALFASRLVGRSYDLSIFGTDIGVDPRAIEDLQMVLVSDHGITAAQYSVHLSINSVSDLLSGMSGMDYVVTCRFHGVVFAHLLNKPVLAIAHHRKVVDLMADLELESYCLNIQDLDVNLLTEKFASMVDNAEDIKRRMAASLIRNRWKINSQFDELFPK